MFRVLYYPLGDHVPEIEYFNNREDALKFIESLRVRKVPYETDSVPLYIEVREDV